MKLRSHLAFQNKLTKSPIDGQVTELIVFSSWILGYMNCLNGVHPFLSGSGNSFYKSGSYDPRSVAIGMGAPRWDNSYTQVSFVWVSHTKYIFFIDLKSILYDLPIQRILGYMNCLNGVHPFLSGSGNSFYKSGIWSTLIKAVSGSR
jgi:hypothetical protein